MATIEISQARLQEWTEMLLALKRSVDPSATEQVDALLASVKSAQGSQAVQSERRAHPDTRQAAADAVLSQLVRWRHDGTWDALTEFAGLLTSVKSSATAGMAERMGTLVATTGGLMARLTESDTTQFLTYVFENQEVVRKLLDQLATWQSDGTWQTLTDLAGLVQAAKQSFSVATVSRLSALTEEGLLVLQRFLDSGALPGGLAILEQLSEAMSQAFHETEQDTKQVTLTGMLRIIKDPQIQITLKTLVALLKKVPKLWEGASMTTP